MIGWLIAIFNTDTSGEVSALSSAAKTGRTLLVLLMVAMLMILGVSEVKADRDRYAGDKEWLEMVRQLRAKGEDVKVLKSKNMTPEKSPRAFLKRYKKEKEKAGENFTFQIFVEDVARGLIIEQRYHETKGIFYVKKENRNPNYQWVAGEEMLSGFNYLSVNYDKFCVTPELLRDVFGKEDRIETSQAKATRSYRYYTMGLSFGVDFIPDMNKNCASAIGFDSHFFLRMEKQ